METQLLGKGSKIGATAIIWSLGAGMLAICIPLVSMTGTGIILPLSVILGVTIATIAVWIGKPQSV